ncbi:hypothetical protein HKCCE3408_01925 [Rhodobacterales bacterium HKCCE3408]|nr:hypothetical protein [Rhodobacterales bacterium HKCCE3408]
MTTLKTLRRAAFAAALSAVAPLAAMADGLLLPMPTPIPLPLPTPTPTPTPGPVVEVLPLPVPLPAPFPGPIIPVPPSPLVYPSCPTGFSIVSQSPSQFSCRRTTEPVEFAQVMQMAQATTCQYAYWNQGPAVQYLGPPTQPRLEWTCRHH